MRVQKTAASGMTWRCAAVWAAAAGLLTASDLFGAPRATGDQELAAALVKTAGVSHGVCCVIGGADTGLPFALVEASHFLVHVADSEESAVQKGRAEAAKKGIGIRRVLFEQVKMGPLPHADNTLDLVVVPDASDELLSKLSAREVLRALRPRGKAFIHLQEGAGVPRKALADWAKDASTKPVPLDDGELRAWLVVEKPVLSGVDDWSHWEHAPDNNPVSTDAVIKAPYMTQWMSDPYYVAMPAITTAAGGRTFVAMGHMAHHEREEAWLNTLLARNGYNGAELWRKRLPDGYLVHRSAFIATDDVFYIINLDGHGCVLLNPETGDEIGQVRIPEVRGEWKWIAIAGQTLYGLAGEKGDPAETTLVRSKDTGWSWGELSKGYYAQPGIPWGFGETIFAYDLKGEKPLWTYRDESEIDSRTMAIGEDRVFFYAPEAHLGCLDAKTGSAAWVNEDAETRRLIDEPGNGLTSTPGFRTSCYCVYTPKALFFEAQTQMNLVAVSKDDGHLLWYHKKTTSNPNVIYVDGNVLTGIGPEGNTLALNPETGEVIEDLGFRKRSCARLTATPDSLFCRCDPEGVTRYDRAMKTVSFDGSMRPACMDGVIGANGLLYIGPWLCDCNLSLMGTVALCSAGGPITAAPAGGRLDVAANDVSAIAPLKSSKDDWCAYRGGYAHTGATRTPVSSPLQALWVWKAASAFTPTAPVAAGGLVFFAGDDGVVRALDAASGSVAWTFETAGPILQPPTIWEGRAYVGSGDGFVYALEAATGRLMWRFRAAPIERRILVHGTLCSTWPVNSGVLVKDGIAYCAAGIIDYDGTYLYALDAPSGALKWANETSGHLNEKLRKGVSAQGNLTFLRDSLYMAGGNIISPARYLLEDGRYDGPLPRNGAPESNRGEEIGVLADDLIVFGGRLRYSAIENVVNPGVFSVTQAPGGATLELSRGHSAPVWDDDLVVVVPNREDAPQAYAAKDVIERARQKGRRNPRLQAPIWKAAGLAKSQTVGLALSRDSVIAVCSTPRMRDLRPLWRLCLLGRDTGQILCEQALPSPARANGIAIDGEGRVLASLADGGLCCYGGNAAFQQYLANLVAHPSNDAERQHALDRILDALDSVRDPAGRELLIATVQNAGIDVFAQARAAGAVTEWRLLGPVPWDAEKNTLDKRLVGEPDVRLNRPSKIEGVKRSWERYVTIESNGRVDLAAYYGDHQAVAAYGYAEVKMAQACDALLQIGSNDGFKCWCNGKEVGRHDGGRTYRPDQDALKVHLASGVNKILMKVNQEGGAWAFGVRITDQDRKALAVETTTP